MYTDCTKENRCNGCNKCTCSAEAKWVCETFSDCAESVPSNEEQEDEQGTDERALDYALEWMLEEMKEQVNDNPKNPYVPQPGLNVDHLLDEEEKTKTDSGSEQTKEEDELLSFFRDKRSVDEKDAYEGKGNETITFHHTIDEVNEDTLKNTNTSGTLQAVKIAAVPLASRRSTDFNATSKSLQIEYTPPIHNQHAADNKVDTSAIHDDQVDLLVHHKIYEMVGNQSQATRDKDLSKILVNELKGGEKEIIGNKNSSVISNITFTSENDTITAIAFIAGNLLNKLWNLEKDTSDSLETENMKHKKINDLLELFKEPLNLRQETFLKNALEHLSTAIENKDIENVSLCKNIEELKKTSGITSEPNQVNLQKASSNMTPEKEQNSIKHQTKSEPKFNKEAATTDALYKINNVLDLIKKYELVQNSLSDIKSKSDKKPTVRIPSDKDLTKDEKDTLKVFGNILETLTKLLIPNKKSKKITKAVKSKNLFNSDKNVRDRFENLNLTDMTITTKDKIVLDYLTHIQNSPRCLLNKQQEKLLLPNIEGDILLNLSEFFKIKSMSDLLKLIDTEKKEEPLMRSIPTMPETQTHKDYYTTETNTQTTEKDNITQFETTKEKLKKHLRSILEDLIQLQNISGKFKKGKDIEISDALPCIYNLLNANRVSHKTIQENIQPKINMGVVKSGNNVKEIFENLKKELKLTSLTRRTNVVSRIRPKSATIWERTIKNLNNKHKLKTRRHLEHKVPKSIEDVNKVIDKIENTGSNTYKSIAYLTEVPAAERLLLLKTLAIDTRKYILALNDIIKSIEAVNDLPINQHNIISEFIDNVIINVNLNRKILNNLDKPRRDIYLSNKEVKPRKIVKVYKYSKEAEMTPSGHNVVKLSRDQILNQLIKNRMQYYLRLKEATSDRKGSINKDLAKKILLYLEIGNDKLARELYKIFVSQNKKKSRSTSNSRVPEPDKYEALNQQRTEKRLDHKVPVPLIQFEGPKVINNKVSLSNQEQLIKQLVNIKNMKA